MKANGYVIRKGRRIKKFGPTLERCLARYLSYLSRTLGGEWQVELRYKSLPRQMRLHHIYLDEWENVRKSFTTYEKVSIGWPRVWLKNSNGLTRNAYFNGAGWRKTSRKKDNPVMCLVRARNG